VITPGPTPSPPTPPSAGSLLHSVWTGLWAAATSSPLVAVFFAIALGGAVVRLARAAIHGGCARDPIRRFTGTDKAVILGRAGGRCEHHAWLGGRCRQIERLEADHIHPWSRGGQTAIANGQALCKRHNRAKRATIPYGWQLRALEKRRATYFAPGISGAIVRRRRTSGREAAQARTQ
jgi:hypothetical protein